MVLNGTQVNPELVAWDEDVATVNFWELVAAGVVDKEETLLMVDDVMFFASETLTDRNFNEVGVRYLPFFAHERRSVRALDVMTHEGAAS